jgi:hypothetical protein
MTHTNLSVPFHMSIYDLATSQSKVRTKTSSAYHRQVSNFSYLFRGTFFFFLAKTIPPMTISIEHFADTLASPFLSEHSFDTIIAL